MFEGLTERLLGVFDRLKKKGVLSDEDVQQSLRQIRLVLLEADVNFTVVKDFLAAVKQRAVGEQIHISLTPAQQMLKIVHQELLRLLAGEQAEPWRLQGELPVLLLCGLNGAGKTTHAAKLASYFAKRGRKPLLVATDVHRPAAIAQLQTLGERIGQPVFQMGDRQEPVHIARAALQHARAERRDLVIIDTAGRLHIDAALMQELVTLHSGVQPTETWLVLDAMTGQDAVNVAGQFEAAVPVDGYVLSKMDSDARGGAALSIRAVTGKPIRFLGIGEKLEDLEEYHPDRIAGRILGQGDMLTVIERAEAAMDAQTAKELEQKLRAKTFDLDDFRSQLRQVTKLGSLDQLLAMVPGVNQALASGQMVVDPSRLARLEAIINSMTKDERRRPDIIKNSRRRRIALGSGTSTREVNDLLRQYQQMKTMFGQMADLEKTSRGRRHLSRMFGR
ncbi:MAG: signal recognition particle protein [Fimbriimonadaceae bacterium]|nr:signal recognition particle protein [Fimbriimonadaceae bacterium]